MKLKELFFNDITQRFDSVSRYTLTTDDYIYQEINEFIFTKGKTGSTGSFQIFKKILDELGKNEQENLWIQGFYGSGKSLLTKLLALSLSKKQMKQGMIFDLLLNKISEEDAKILQHAYNLCAFDSITFFNVSGRRQSNSNYHENIVTIIIRELFCKFELSSSLETAFAEITLKNMSKTEEFLNWLQNKKKANWNFIKNKPVAQKVIHDFFSHINLKFPEIPILDKRNPERWVKGLIEIIKKLPSSKHLLILDEVSKHLDSHEEDIELFEIFLKNLTASQIQLICTGQTPISEYGKLKNNFKEIEVDKINIDEIIIGRLLKKNESSTTIIKDFIKKNSLIFDSEDNDSIEIYPFTSLTLELLKVITKHVKQQNEEQQTARSILGMIHQYLSDSADNAAQKIHGIDGFHKILLKSFDDCFQQNIAAAFLKIQNSKSKDNLIETKFRRCIVEILISITPLYDKIGIDNIENTMSKDSLGVLLQKYLRTSTDRTVSVEALTLFIQHSYLGQELFDQSFVQKQLDWLEKNLIIQFMEHTGYTLRLQSIAIWNAHQASVQIKKPQVLQCIKNTFNNIWSKTQLYEIELPNTATTNDATSIVKIGIQIKLEDHVMVKKPDSKPYIEMHIRSKELTYSEDNQIVFLSKALDFTEDLFKIAESLLIEESMYKWSEKHEESSSSLWSNLQRQTEKRKQQNKTKLEKLIKSILCSIIPLEKGINIEEIDKEEIDKEEIDKEEIDKEVKNVITTRIQPILEVAARNCFHQHHYCGEKPKTLTNWVSILLSFDSKDQDSHKTLSAMQKRMLKNNMKFFTGSSLEPKGVLVDWLLKYSDTNLTNIITHAYSPPFAFNQEEIHLTLAALFIQGQIEFHKIGQKDVEILSSNALIPDTIAKVSTWKRLRTYTLKVLQTELLSIPEIEALQRFLGELRHTANHEKASSIFEEYTKTKISDTFETFLENSDVYLAADDKAKVLKEQKFFRDKFQSRYLTAKIVKNLKDFVKKLPQFEKVYKQVSEINEYWKQIEIVLLGIPLMRSSKNSSHVLSEIWNKVLNNVPSGVSDVSIAILMLIITDLEVLLEEQKVVQKLFKSKVDTFWQDLEKDIQSNIHCKVEDIGNLHVPECLRIDDQKLKIHHIDISCFKQLKNIQNNVYLFFKEWNKTISACTILFTSTEVSQDTATDFFTEVRTTIKTTEDSGPFRLSSNS